MLPTLTDALAAVCPAPVDLETVEGDNGLVAALRPARGGPAEVREEWLLGPESCPGLE